MVAAGGSEAGEPHPSALDHGPALLLLSACSLAPPPLLLGFKGLRPVIQPLPQHCIAGEARLVILHQPCRKGISSCRFFESNLVLVAFTLYVRCLFLALVQGKHSSA